MYDNSKQVMTKYISNPDNLKLMMNMLKEKSRNIQFEAFHVFKVNNEIDYRQTPTFSINPLFPPVSGICSESEQTETDSRHPAAESGEAGRLPNEIPHGPIRGRTVQRRKGVPNQADKGAETGSGSIVIRAMQARRLCNHTNARARIQTHPIRPHSCPFPSRIPPVAPAPVH